MKGERSISCMEMHLSGVAVIAAQGGCSGRVCALPLPSCDHLTSLAHHAWQNENSELLKTLLAVPDEPEQLKRCWRGGHSQGSCCFLCWGAGAQGRTVNVFRLGSTRLHQGLGLAQGLGGCKTNRSVPGAHPASMESQRNAEQVHSAPPKLDIFKNCIYSSSQAQGQYLESMP